MNKPMEQGILCAEDVREIYRNTTAGKESIEILRPLSENEGFRNVLTREDKEYTDFAQKIEVYATENGIDIKEVSPFARGMMYISAILNTVVDKTPSKLASVMIQGINMGEISILKIINKLADDGKQSPLCEDMLALLRKNKEEMSLFL